MDGVDSAMMMCVLALDCIVLILFHYILQQNIYIKKCCSMHS